MPTRMVASPRPERAAFLAASLCLILATLAGTQAVDALDLSSVGRDSRWKVVNRTTSIVDMKGHRALRVSEAPGMGIVWTLGR